MESVEQVIIDDERVPALGLGTWQLTGRRCRQAIEDALELGYRHVDTAQMYGNEREVGAAIGASGIPADDLWVTTKLDNDAHDPDAVRTTTEESLAQLGLDRVDLLLVHWPVEFDILPATCGACLELCEAGLVRHLGVSNFTKEQLEEAHRHAPIFAVQVEYHPFLDQDELIEECRTREVLFTAYSPLARGRVLRDETIARIAQGHGRTPAQVTLRWLLDQGIAAIPKASSRAHLAENLEVSNFDLTGEDRRAIRYLTERRHRIVDPDFAPWND